MSQESKRILKKQTLFFSLIGASVLLAITGFSLFFSREEKENVYVARPIDLPGDKIEPQEIWMTRMEEQNKNLDTKLKFLENLIMESKKRETETSNENLDLKNRLAFLKQELKETKEQAALEKEARFARTEEPMFSFVEEDSEKLATKRLGLIEVIAEGGQKKTQHVDKSIPSGTTVKAVLVSSVDAPCGAFSTSDPHPVKLRIIDDGRLPKCVRARLKGGLVIAGVHGDLSNERVYMRLERLTQLRPGGEYIETGISGFVSGEDGKYGVRGTVVDKSCKLVGNAAVSGIFSGINNYFESLARSQYYNACCDGGYQEHGYGLLREGSFSGASNAFDMLTDYYIKRAEQIRPVIQVTAGRIVDITFTHSADLGDLYVKDKVKREREESRQEAFP